MLAHMKKPHTEKIVDFALQGVHYVIPISVMKKYKVPKSDDCLRVETVFKDLIKEHGEPPVLLRGLRHREGLTQVEFAKKIEVTQANLSAMENGRRSIGKEVAKRIAKKFDVDYRIFL